MSIPRNLARVQFPPGSPLAAAFPNGFDDLANAIFPYVSTRPDLMEHYGAGGLLCVDLAWSERVRKSGSINDARTMSEAQSINKSISTLGLCIHTLAAAGERLAALKALV